MGTPKNHAADYAIELARSLEARLGPGTGGELDILEDVLELTADTNGTLTVVLTIGGPHAELILGAGSPRIEVWWGGKHATELVNLDDNLVDTFLTTWYRATLEAALLR
jgi:hypothetical protein